MHRYIGLDAHGNTCTLAVVNDKGRQLALQVLETNGTALRAAVRAIPRPNTLCTEEGTHSAWLYELLGSLVDELVVIQPERREGQKTDAHDALFLANSVRVGSYKRRVFKAPSRFTALRALSHAYSYIRDDLTRAKNRLKAIYRSRGVPTTGQSVYGGSKQTWLRKLPAAHRSATELLHWEVDHLAELKEVAAERLLEESHKHDAARILATAPGLGPIGVALLIPVVVTPHRFRTSRQYWQYCGFGIINRSSADWVKRDGDLKYAPRGRQQLTTSFCRPLKALYKQAAVTVLRSPTHPLRQHYDRLVESGTRASNARTTIARRIAAITLSMWKNREPYDPARLKAAS